MKIKNAQDFWSGVMFLCIGLVGILLSRNYAMGTAAKMGPGYFPTMLCGILVLMGIVIALMSITSKTSGDIPSVNFKIITWICASIILFGVLLNYMGLFVACFVVIFFSSLASDEHSYVVSIIGALILSIASVAIFSWGLKLQFEVWPPFLAH